MTTEANTRQVLQGFAEALRDRHNGEQKVAGLFRSVLSTAKLSAEQQTVADLIITLMDDDEPEAPDETYPEASTDYDAETEEPEGAPEDLEDELEALREANDTMAAALGACPLCWGGDPGCVDCRGKGCPGYRQPDRALFDQLVMPAIRRIHATKRPPESRVGYYR